MADNASVSLLSVVIPAYNEEKVLPETAETLLSALSRMAGNGLFSDFEILFVNDGSLDGTAAVLARIAETDAHFRVLGYEKNRGKGCAVRTGVLASRGDFVLYTDSDLAYGTDVIADAVGKITGSGTDFVVGSRAIHPEGYAGYTFLRRAASVCYLRFLSLAAGFPLSDSQCGFKGMRGESGRAVFADCTTDGFAFDFELLMRAARRGMTFAELPVRVLHHGESKIHLVRDSIRMLGDIAQIKKKLKREEKDTVK